MFFFLEVVLLLKVLLKICKIKALSFKRKVLIMILFTDVIKTFILIDFTFYI